MKTTTLIFGFCLALALSTSFAADKEKPAPTPSPAADKEKPAPTPTRAADKEKSPPTPSPAADKEKSAPTPSPDTTFIHNAAEASIAEVAVGKVAEKNGQREDVKTFATHMIKDHGKASENLKGIATKISAPFPEKLRPKRQFKIDKMSKLSGADFDAAYINTMVQDHENIIAGFERARTQVSNEDLKKFIDTSLPVLKEHLEAAKKMQSAK